MTLGDTRLHASAEWFEAITPYVVIQGEEFVTQQPEVVRQAEAVQQLEEVFNWGAGIEHAFTAGFRAYASYYTDNSGLGEGVERASLSILPIDIQTVTVGSNFVVGSARFTLGAGFGWGKKVDQNLTDALKYAVVAGAVTGGGLTVIANAPNPAGQAILNKHFDDGIAPAGLLKAAFVPTVIMFLAFAVFA